MITGEHEFEAQPGLPERLPAGERLLWQGRPATRVLARDAMHWRKLCAYFAALLAWRAAVVLGGGGGWLDAVVAAAWLLPLAAFAIGIALVLASLVSRTTVYTLTDRRVVMRIGIVLTLTLNLPLRRIDSAALHMGPDDHGDIALTLCPGNRIGYIHLWPHARPWRLQAPQPMLRALPDARRVAAMLARALQASASATATAEVDAGTDNVVPLQRPQAPTVAVPVADLPAQTRAA